MTWSTVDKLVPLIDDTYHETLVSEHVDLHQPGHDHVFHGVLQCARDFLYQAAVVQKTDRMNTTLDFQKDFWIKHNSRPGSYFDCILHIEWLYEGRVLSDYEANEEEEEPSKDTKPHRRG